MEQLTASVYECTLAVEAHMVCDLLARAGISARVDGEFLSGVGGELPLGNTVKVRVDPARATEAREVIAEWEKSQASGPPAPAGVAPRARSGLWFLVGVLGGVALSFVLLGLRQPRVDSAGTDHNGDGRHDEWALYTDSYLARLEHDRNFDDRVDSRWTYDHGLPRKFEGDDDFDGRFEWRGEVRDGEISRLTLDSDGDGRPEQTWYQQHGVLSRVDFHHASGGRIVKREHYVHGLPASAEYDADGDGAFERRVEFDAHAEPKM
jgi:hypothetical protein